MDQFVFTVPSFLLHKRERNDIIIYGQLLRTKRSLVDFSKQVTNTSTSSISSNKCSVFPLYVSGRYDVVKKQEKWTRIIDDYWSTPIIKCIVTLPF